MSKDWVIISREEAARILRKVTNICLEKIRNEEDKCSKALVNIASDHKYDHFYDKDEIIALGKCWSVSGIPDERYPEVRITDAIRNEANRLLEGALDHLKISISRKAAEEILD